MKSTDKKPEQTPTVAISKPCTCGEDCPCKKKKDANSTKKILTVVSMLILGSVTTLHAQEATAPGFLDDPFNSPLLPLFLVMGLLVVTVVLMIFLSYYLLKVMNILTEEAEQERARRLGISLTKKPSWLEEWWERMNASVPVSKEMDIDTGHNYDGIRELDNHLPPWWKGLFYGSMVFAVIYLVMYHVFGTLPLSEQEYLSELSQAEEQARAFRASQPAELIDENSLTYSADAAILEKGKKVFTSSNCGSCHRNDGGGNNIGPNLTDEHWIHGGSIKNIFTTINKGFVEKGMPAWGKAMSLQDVRNVAFYIMSLQGTQPPNPKAPQGELFKQQAVALDTARASASR